MILSTAGFVRLLTYFFFALMMIIPTTQQLPRGVILIVLLVIGGLHSIRANNWRLHWEVGFIALFCITTSVFFILKGVVNNHPAMQLGGVYVVWPIIFVFTMGVFNKYEQLLPFSKVIVLGGICAALLGVLVVFEALNFIDFGLLEFFGKGLRVDASGTTISLTMPSLVTVMYVLPFLFSMLMMPAEAFPLNVRWRKVCWFGLLISFVVLVFSGRRAFWVSSAFAPFVFLFFAYLCDIRFQVKSMIFIAILSLLMAFLLIISLDIDVEAMWFEFLDGFDFSETGKGDASTRRLQFTALLHDWVQNPLLGSGHGAGATGYIGDPESPFSYELSYMSLLFHTGIVGFTFYSFSVVWLLVRSVIVMREDPLGSGFMLPLIVGLSCFLVANTSNPYLEKFDYLWVLFLPIALLNARLLESSKVNRVASSGWASKGSVKS